MEFLQSGVREKIKLSAVSSAVSKSKEKGKEKLFTNKQNFYVKFHLGMNAYFIKMKCEYIINKNK